MPEIDTDLFQVVALGLLGITVLLLLAVLSVASGIRKSLTREAPGERTARPAPWATEDTGDGSEPSVAAAQGAEDLEVPGGFEAPLTEGPAASGALGAETSADEPRRAEPLDSQTTEPEPGLVQPSPTAQEEVQGELSALAADDEPVAAGAGAAEENPFMRDRDQPAPQSTLEEPQDQPFERGGRWYFRRGDELLVYDEGTGEWGPADSSPSGAGPTPTTTAGPSATESSAPIADTSEEAAEPEPADTAASSDTEEFAQPTASGGFWKCPSCGAVNGASASTCRMCFSARP